jgi:hypothetical protein
VKEPHPDLVYGQVIKKKRQERLQELVSRVCCGAERLEALGLSSSSRLIERRNLTLRHALAPLVRKSQSFCKDRTQMRRRVVFFQAFDNFARPHMSLRLPLPEQEPPTEITSLVMYRASGEARKAIRCAMSSGSPK